MKTFLFYLAVVLWSVFVSWAAVNLLLGGFINWVSWGMSVIIFASAFVCTEGYFKGGIK